MDPSVLCSKIKNALCCVCGFGASVCARKPNAQSSRRDVSDTFGENLNHPGTSALSRFLGTAQRRTGNFSVISVLTRNGLTELGYGAKVLRIYFIQSGLEKIPDTSYEKIFFLRKSIATCKHLHEFLVHQLFHQEW